MQKTHKPRNFLTYKTQKAYQDSKVVEIQETIDIFEKSNYYFFDIFENFIMEFSKNLKGGFVLGTLIWNQSQNILNERLGFYDLKP